jgi:hypothetical protein
MTAILAITGYSSFPINLSKDSAWYFNRSVLSAFISILLGISENVNFRQLQTDHEPDPNLKHYFSSIP